MLSNKELLTHGLKEWAIAVDALGKGETIVLLRKGGIREDSKHFQVRYQKVWLYPTYEHQKPQLLKSEYSSRIKEVTSGWHPDFIEIKSCGEITHTLEVNSLEILQKIEPFQIWNRQMVCDRFKWKPQQPLSILLLKVANLPTPVTIPYHPSYGGCKSWIDLQQPISLQDLTPALAPDVYEQKVNEILNLTNSQVGRVVF